MVYLNNKKLILFFILFLFIGNFYIAQDNQNNNNSNPEQSLNLSSNVSSDNESSDNISSGVDINDETIVQKQPSLFETLKKGGIMMIPLLLLLLASLTIIMERIIFYSKNQAWSTKNFRSFIRNFASNSKSKYKEVIEEELKESGKNYIHKVEKGLGLLNGIGNIAPLVGFLGTVTGMIGAFAAIANASTVNAKIVASGIQEALVTTASGLVIAVPTLIAYYIFINISQSMEVALDNEIQDFCKDKPSLAESDKE